MKDFFDFLDGRKLVIFGSGSASQAICMRINPKNIAYFVDNDSMKHDQLFMGCKIYSPDILYNEDKSKVFILVASMYFNEISQQLEHMGFMRGEQFQNSVLLENIGKRFKCLFCNGYFKSFLPMGNDIYKNGEIMGGSYRENAVCPCCGSFDRERLVYYYLKSKAKVFDERLKVLHIAPEVNLQAAFNKSQVSEYVCGDLCPNDQRNIIKLDITDINFPSDYFDIIICNHVLEHVPEDKKAMTELYRVLKPNGFAILQVPLSKNLKQTYEDPTITSPEQRRTHFGQEDHVRIYGMDYVDRLQESGFLVNIYDVKKDLDVGTILKYSFIMNEVVFVCNKKVDNDSNYNKEKILEQISYYWNK
ncbi:MAG: methyltransferase type 11 [Clostridia bacterium]|jgi:predicted SAM-dependent methyltransferase|nr:methyltransferase type 11 [Clostridia bacterium]